ncbi:uroporphyrinogen decarboxylase-like [Tubulanus polymorphus]|uniref:uroporphyrinogen decarboxylase-like n=1 Tax=Tubulanus polymorphus TaxID=672921 RepID=UPI003DA45728
MDCDKTGKVFPPLKNDTLLKAARGEKVKHVPVWVMRQAGRYLPEFKELRSKHSFIEMCHTPELACEVTLQPLRRFPLDGAIIFSDILVVNKALGVDFELIPEKGIHVPNPLKSPEDISRLKTDIDIKKELSYVFDAITLTRHKLEGKVPLLGFCGAPWTLMTYMVESDSSPGKELVKKWLYEYPEASHKLLHIIANVLVDYLTEQVLAGAQMLQVFESHAGCLGTNLFNKFSLPYVTDIAKRVKENLQAKNIQPVPMVIFANGGHYAIEDLAHSSYDVIGLDWTVKPKNARRLAGTSVSLQGNLDPSALFAPKEEISRLVKEMLDKFGKDRYIANLGHGISRYTDPEHMAAFVEAIHQYSTDSDDE